MFPSRSSPTSYSISNLSYQDSGRIHEDEGDEDDVIVPTKMIFPLLRRPSTDYNRDRLSMSSSSSFLPHHRQLPQRSSSNSSCSSGYNRNANNRAALLEFLSEASEQPQRRSIRSASFTAVQRRGSGSGSGGKRIAPAVEQMRRRHSQGQEDGPLFSSRQPLQRRFSPQRRSREFVSPPQPRERVVRFASRVAKEDTSVLTITEEEHREMWYSSKELSEMVKERKQLLKANKLRSRSRSTYNGILSTNDDVDVDKSKDPSLDTDEEPETTDFDAYCMRGLEEFVSIRASVEKRNRYVACIQSVLDAQKKYTHQTSSLPSKEEYLRTISRHVTQRSEEIALELASKDAKDSYWYTTSTTLNTNDNNNNIIISDQHQEQYLQKQVPKEQQEEFNLPSNETSKSSLTIDRKSRTITLDFLQ